MFVAPAMQHAHDAAVVVSVKPPAIESSSSSDSGEISSSSMLASLSLAGFLGLIGSSNVLFMHNSWLFLLLRPTVEPAHAGLTAKMDCEPMFQLASARDSTMTST